MSRKRQVGGNPPAVIQVVGGSGYPIPNIVQAATAVVQDPLSSTLSMLNSNPYLIGVFQSSGISAGLLNSRQSL